MGGGRTLKKFEEKREIDEFAMAWVSTMPENKAEKEKTIMKKSTLTM